MDRKSRINKDNTFKHTIISPPSRKSQKGGIRPKKVDLTPTLIHTLDNTVN